jgi:cytochrome c
MDSFEFNKIAGALLGTLLLVMGIGTTSNIIFAPTMPSVPGFDLPSGEASSGAATAPQAAAPAVPLPELLAKADVKKGESAARKCAACHSFEKGGANKVGPNLYNVVGGAKAHIAGFNYSAAMKDAAGKGEKWTFETLNAFIENPKKYMAGTSMAFAGVSRAEERADILAYLRSLSDSPQPLPQN